MQDLKKVTAERDGFQQKAFGLEAKVRLGASGLVANGLRDGKATELQRQLAEEQASRTAEVVALNSQLKAAKAKGTVQAGDGRAVELQRQLAEEQAARKAEVAALNSQLEAAKTKGGVQPGDGRAVELQRQLAEEHAARKVEVAALRSQLDGANISVAAAKAAASASQARVRGLEEEMNSVYEIQRLRLTSLDDAGLAAPPAHPPQPNGPYGLRPFPRATSGDVSYDGTPAAVSASDVARQPFAADRLPTAVQLPRHGLVSPQLSPTSSPMLARPISNRPPSPLSFVPALPKVATLGMPDSPQGGKKPSSRRGSSPRLKDRIAVFSSRGGAPSASPRGGAPPASPRSSKPDSPRQSASRGASTNSPRTPRRGAASPRPEGRD